VLPDLLVQLPWVGTAGTTRREPQLARIDLSDRLAHSLRVQLLDASRNPTPTLPA